MLLTRLVFTYLLCSFFVLTVQSFSLFGFGESNKTKEDQFLDWFTAHGGIYKVGLKDFPLMGRGVFALEDIDSETEVLRIPNKLIFCRESLTLSSDPLHVSYMQKIREDETAIIGVLLLEVYRGKDSLFYEYLQMLPAYIPNLSYFGESSLEQLQSVSLMQDALRAQKGFQSDYTRLVKIMKKSKMWPGTKDTLPTYDQYLWAASIIDSRGLRFQGKVHLAPFADMFNYEPHKDAREREDGNFFLKHHQMIPAVKASEDKEASSGYMSILADRDAKVGEQLLEDYGDNRDKIYLQYHGFVTEYNPFRCHDLLLPSMDEKNSADLALAADESPIMSDTMRSLLRSLRFETAPEFCVEYHGTLDMATVVYTAVLGMTNKELARCQGVVDTIDSESNDSWKVIGEKCGFFTVMKEYQSALARNAMTLEVSRVKNPSTDEEEEEDDGRGGINHSKPFEKLIQNIRLHIDATLDSYPTSIDTDEALLNDWTGGAVGTDGHGHAHNELQQEHDLSALRYRLYNKKHLMELKQLYSYDPDGSKGAARNEAALAANAKAGAAAGMAANEQAGSPKATSAKTKANAKASASTSSSSTKNSKSTNADTTAKTRSKIKFKDRSKPNTPPPPPQENGGAGKCNPGFSSENNGINCDACEIGKYKLSVGNFACDVCDINSVDCGNASAGTCKTGFKSFDYGVTCVVIEESSVLDVIDMEIDASGEAIGPPKAANEGHLGVGEMPIDTSMYEAGMTLKQQLERFNTWFTEASNMTNATNKLSANFIPGWRIGTIATEDIEDKEIYLSVPLKVILDSNGARKHEKLKDLFKRITEVYGLEAKDDFHELLFFLLYEMRVKGSDSYYWPYLALLPTPADQTIVPTRWTQNELKRRLGPSHIITMVNQYTQLQEKTYASITQILPIKTFFDELDVELGRETDPLLSWDNYRWAQTVLDSRTIWWQNDRHLVPMLDFINCVEGPEPTRVHRTDMDESYTHATTAASWAFPKGDQVFENYGQANYIYFMYHGFALPVGSNVHDCVHHDISFGEEDKKNIDFSNKDAQNLAQQLGLNRKGTVSTCLAAEGTVFQEAQYTLKKEVWLALALKQNNFIELKKQKLLGLPNKAAMVYLLEQLRERLLLYRQHFGEYDSTHDSDRKAIDASIMKSSIFFLQTEAHHLGLVCDYLAREIAAKEAANEEF